MMTPSTCGRDTTPEAREVMWRALRSLDGCARAGQAFDMSDDLRARVEAGVRRRHPGYDQASIKLVTLRLWLGDELFALVHPETAA